MSKYPKFPQEATEKQKVDILRKIVDEMIDYFTDSRLIFAQNKRVYEITRVNRKSWGRIYDTLSKTL
jgi:predicted TIM-barrel fold metal-dependent hydrolase